MGVPKLRPLLLVLTVLPLAGACGVIDALESAAEESATAEADVNDRSGMWHLDEGLFLLVDESEARFVTWAQQAGGCWEVDEHQAVRYAETDVTICWDEPVPGGAPIVHEDVVGVVRVGDGLLVTFKDEDGRDIELAGTASTQTPADLVPVCQLPAGGDDHDVDVCP